MTGRFVWLAALIVAIGCGGGDGPTDGGFDGGRDGRDGGRDGGRDAMVDPDAARDAGTRDAGEDALRGDGGADSDGGDAADAGFDAGFDADPGGNAFCRTLALCYGGCASPSDSPCIAACDEMLGMRFTGAEASGGFSAFRDAQLCGLRQRCGMNGACVVARCGDEVAACCGATDCWPRYGATFDAGVDSGSDAGDAGCIPETDGELCAAASLECGPGTRRDRCGTDRSLDCGACDSPATCGGGACRCATTPDPTGVTTTCSGTGDVRVRFEGATTQYYYHYQPGSGVPRPCDFDSISLSGSVGSNSHTLRGGPLGSECGTYRLCAYAATCDTRMSEGVLIPACRDALGNLSCPGT